MKKRNGQPAALPEMGCHNITGGGPGLMQAANDGAALRPKRAKSIGIRIDLPFEQEENAFTTEIFHHRTFLTQLHQFVLASDGYVVAPAGIGTMLETLMIWQLVQVQQLQRSP
jgi:predicted Rossmann-fold nucleotide-binding protein